MRANLISMRSVTSALGKSTASTVAALMFMTAPPAEARRTVVDFAPDDPELLYPIATDIGGYCDFDGYDCQSVPLGFSVYFTNYQGYGSAIAYGNGVLEFTNQDGDANALVNGNTSGATITGGAMSTASEDFYYNYSFEHGVDWSALSVSLYSCTSTTSCYRPVWEMTLAPQVDGFAVSVTYNQASPFGGWSPSYSVPASDHLPYGAGESFTVQGGAGTKFEFFVPAKFYGLDFPPTNPDPGAVPEPATWAMMIAGFGVIGGALRRRRRTRRPTRQFA